MGPYLRRIPDLPVGFTGTYNINGINYKVGKMDSTFIETVETLGAMVITRYEACPA
jgi:hypothetical protein